MLYALKLHNIMPITSQNISGKKSTYVHKKACTRASITSLSEWQKPGNKPNVSQQLNG